MKIPAIKAKIGNWTYYITTLTFKQISENVEKIDEELHKSETLRDLIQRSITSNYIKIKEYILNQPELFFNSLVLAVYDEYPIWNELNIEFEDESYNSIGFLDFPGKHKIFPVDGQHRVEGIKDALRNDPSILNQEVGAIFIGHINDNEGKQRTRRLFTTLNRYAKPVTLDDIIALDEDDIVAIITRNLVENYDLFSGSRTVISKQKGIPDSDKTAVTSIITLYQANKEIFKDYFQTKFELNPTKSRIDEKYLRYRPEEEIIEDFRTKCTDFWDCLKKSFNEIEEYSKISEKDKPAIKFRNRNNGGHLLFRPVGLLPFVQAVFLIKKRTNINEYDIIQKLSNYEYLISSKPWEKIVWNSFQKTMIMGSTVLTKNILIYAFNPKVLTKKEQDRLAKQYADKIGFDDEDYNKVLNEIPTLNLDI